jgi:hypothetical protein
MALRGNCNVLVKYKLFNLGPGHRGASLAAMFSRDLESDFNKRSSVTQN